ncbi:MAG: class I SAM-dependent rRNA methyltransferase [Nitrospiria bacterium]
MKTLPTLLIRSKAFQRLRTGHPWIYANELIRRPKHWEPGQLVNVKADTGAWIGRGYYNPGSIIAIRLLTREDIPIDEVFFHQKIQQAQALRERLLPMEEAYRLVFGEADGLPGLIIDRYGSVLVAQFLTAGMDRLSDTILKVLVNRFHPTAVVARNDTPSRKLEGLPVEKKLLHGELPASVVISKNGLSFEVDAWEGQKTGFFLDQSENYRALAELSQGKRVLDAFCYTGAWGLHALHYGATSVLGLDSSEKAIQQAQANTKRNGMVSRATFQQEEVFDGLRKLLSSGERYDLIILDPPSFAKNRREIKDAIRGYKEINRLAMMLLTGEGMLITCSCSHLVDHATFRDMLVAAAADAQRSFRVVAWRTQGPDHPIILGIPETEYLKCVILQTGRL